MNAWPSMLLLGSASRNCGKTHFACRLIESWAPRRRILGLKVTVIRDEEQGSGCPRGGEGCGVCGSLGAPYELAEELLGGDDKDTRRMLAAGAHQVWWLRAHRLALEEGIRALRSRLDPTLPLICESNSLRLALEPGLFLMIQNPLCPAVKATARAVLGLADRIVLSDGSRHDLDVARLRFQAGRWQLRERAQTGDKAPRLLLPA